MTTEDQDQTKNQEPEDRKPADEQAEEQKPEEKKPAPRRRTRRATASAADASAETGGSSDAEAVAPGAAAEDKPAPRRRASRARAAATKDGPQEEAAAPARTPVVSKAPPRMLEKLRNEIGPTMMQEFGYTSPMQIPRLTKIVLNIGLGEALTNARALEAATGDLTLITGQKPVTTRAKKSIAGFKIRDGMPIGLSVTLRGRRMYEFMDRLVSSTLPRIRDFQGISRNSFDGRGNFSLGIREQVIFPEIDYNNIDRIRGLQVVVVTTAPNDAEGLRLLELMGVPFTRTQEERQVA